ncbi:MAG: DUF4255 domain-containing protein [Kofleriaceae bacterium]
MSNTLAIGAVTSALQQMLNSVRTPLPGDPPSDPELADAYCSVRSLDLARDPSDKRNQLNLFLYQLQQSSTFRNMNMQSVHDGEHGQQPLSLDLYYVLTAYGANDEDLLAHRMLGRAMLLLHDSSTLTRDQLRLALSGNDVWRQVERVRIRPQPFGPEEISKLWTGFGKPYRLSVCYQVSIVLIESTAPAIAQLPVLTRGHPQGTPPREPGVVVSPTLDSAYPSLDHFTGALRRPAARIGEVLTLHGAVLGGTPLVVWFAHPLLATPNTVVVNTPHDATQFQVVIPNDDVNWPAGIYTVTVDVPSTPVRTTNSLPVPLAPKIASIGKVSSDPSLAVLSLTISPDVRAEQKVSLIIDGRVIPTDTVGGGNSLLFTVPDPPSGGTGTTPPVLLRVRVDGIDSLVIADYTKSPPEYDPTQSLVLP